MVNAGTTFQDKFDELTKSRYNSQLHSQLEVTVTVALGEIKDNTTLGTLTDLSLDVLKTTNLQFTRDFIFAH